MKKAKQWLAMLLVATMIVGMVPQTAFATELSETEVEAEVEAGTETEESTEVEGITETIDGTEVEEVTESEVEPEVQSEEEIPQPDGEIIEEYTPFVEGETLHHISGSMEMYVFTPETDGWYLLSGQSANGVDTFQFMGQYMYSYVEVEGGDPIQNQASIYTATDTCASYEKLVWLVGGNKYFFSCSPVEVSDENSIDIEMAIYKKAEIKEITLETAPTVVSTDYLDYTGAQCRITYSDDTYSIADISMNGENGYLSLFDWGYSFISASQAGYAIDAGLSVSQLNNGEMISIPNLETGDYTATIAIGCYKYTDGYNTWEKEYCFDLPFSWNNRNVETFEIINLKTDYTQGFCEGITFESIQVKFSDQEELETIPSYLTNFYLKVIKSENGEDVEYRCHSADDYIQNGGSFGETTLYVQYKNYTLETTITIYENPYERIELIPKKSIYYAGFSTGNDYSSGEKLEIEDFSLKVYKKTGEEELYDTISDIATYYSGFSFEYYNEETQTTENTRYVDEYLAMGGSLGDVTISFGWCELESEVTLTIAENPYDHIAIHTAPAKTQYLHNSYDGLDVNGIEIYAYKDAAETEYDIYSYINNEYSQGAIENWATYFYTELGGHEMMEALEVGTHPVTVTLFGKTTTYDIQVVDSLVKSIEVISLPNKIVYYAEADSGIDTSGLAIEITDLDGNKRKYKTDQWWESEEYGNWSDIQWDLQITDNIDWNTSGTYPVTVEYWGASTTFDIIVEENPIRTFEILSMPEQTTCYQYEATMDFNFKGLRYRIEFSDGTVLDETYSEDFTGNTFVIEHDGMTHYAFVNWANWDENYHVALGDNHFVIEVLGKQIHSSNIQILESPIESLEITKNPESLYVFQNSPIDLYGMEVVVNYTDGSSRTIVIEEHCTEFEIDDGYDRQVQVYQTNMWNEDDEEVLYLVVKYYNAEDKIELSENITDAVCESMTLEQQYRVDVSTNDGYSIYSFTPEESGTYYVHVFKEFNNYGMEFQFYEGNMENDSGYVYDYSRAFEYELTAGTTYYFSLDWEDADEVRSAYIAISSTVSDIGQLVPINLEVTSREKNSWYEFERPSWELEIEDTDIELTFENGWEAKFHLDYYEDAYNVLGRRLGYYWKYLEYDEDDEPYVAIRDDNALVYKYGDLTYEVPVQFGLESPVESIEITNNTFETAQIYEYQVMGNLGQFMEGLSVSVKYKDGSPNKTITFEADEDGYISPVRLDGYYAYYDINSEWDEDEEKYCYYCIVTYMGCEAKVRINILPNPIESVEVLTLPENLVCYPLEDTISIDLYGLKVCLEYSDGTTKEVEVDTHTDRFLVDNSYGQYLEGYTTRGWDEDDEYCTYLNIRYMGKTARVGKYEKLPMSEMSSEIISLDEIKHVSLDRSKQYELFKFVPQTTGEYTFSSLNNLDSEAGYYCDTYGIIYSSTGTELVSDDESGDSNNFAVTYEMTAGKTYYLLARLYSVGNGEFDCTITFKESSAPQVETISSLEMRLSTPVAGQWLPDFWEEEYENYSLRTYSWLNDVEDDECADYGTAHRVKLVLSPNKGYQFTSSTTVYINDKRVTTKSVGNDGRITIYYTFPYTACKVSVPSVEGFDLVLDQNVTEGVVEYGGSYRFAYVKTDETLNSNLIVKANDKVLTPDANGYYTITNIKENITVYVKTEQVIVDTNYETKVTLHNKSDAVYDILTGNRGETIAANEIGENTLPTLESYVGNSNQFFFGWYRDKDSNTNGTGVRFISTSILAQPTYELYAKWGSGIFTYTMNGKPVNYKILSIDESNKLKVQVGDGANHAANAQASRLLLAVAEDEGNTLVIPERINPDDTGLTELGISVAACDVVAIAPNAFVGEDFTAIELPDTIESIGANAFAGCTELKEVVIPSSVTNIEEGTFSGCTALTDVVVSEGVTSIRANAFDGCESLSTVVLPDTIEEIDESAFTVTEEQNLTVVCTQEVAQNDAIKDLQENGATVVKVDVAFDYQYDEKAFIVNDTTWQLSAVVNENDELTERTVTWSYTDTDAFDFAVSGNTLNITPLRTMTADEVVVVTATDESGMKKSLNLKVEAIDLNAEDGDGDACYTLELQGASNYVYTGSEICPSVVVRHAVTGAVVESSNYVVSYRENVDVGTATVVVTGTGNYDGTLRTRFDISALDISKTTVTLGTTEYTYDGSAKCPAVTVKNGNITLVEDEDYTVQYKNNVNIGTATVTISGWENYTGSVNKTFTIKAVSIEGASVTLGAATYTYDGSAKQPSVTVKVGNKTLTSGTDYTVQYKNNVNVGTATVTITGKGAYVGTINKKFTITAAAITNESVSLGTTTYTYDGSAKQPGVTVKVGNKTLTSGTDYTVQYKNNVNVGTATVTITAKGNYTGTVNKTFTITAAAITNESVSLGTTTYTYDGKAKQPGVTVKVGNKTLTSGTDYTVQYKDNVNVGTATVTVTGKGNYAGSASKTFAIGAASISKATVKLSKTSYNYSGKANKPTVTVKLNNVTLKKDTDYKLTYKNNKNIGTATVTITGTGNYTDKLNETFKITVKKNTAFEVSGLKYKITNVSGKEVSFTGIKSTKTTKVTIPKTVKYGGATFKVTAVADKALKGKSKVTQVSVGDNVKTIGTSAFAGCTKLSKVTIGKTVTTIGNSAFEGCTKLSTVTIGGAVTKIGDKAFKKCTALKKITIPSKVKTIGKETFYGCKNLKTITIKSTKLTSVGKNALKGIYSKATIKVPKSKLTAYKKLLKNKGQGKKVKITK